MNQIISTKIRQFKVFKSLYKYFKSYTKYSFKDDNCKEYEQYKACITRLYHTVEKGLAHENYRPGFGSENINKLIALLRDYSAKFDINEMFYCTALSTLYEYISKNENAGLFDDEIKEAVYSLPGTPNSMGGIIEFKPVDLKSLQNINYESFVKSRHSIRHFSDEEVDLELILSALTLAQRTPSACNRQGWNAKVIINKQLISNILANQNGNRGFGNEIKVLLLIVGDLRAQNIDRELFQVYIDSGMYAMSVINSLHYYGLATIPLSASLTPQQDDNVRKLLKLHNAEVPVMFIGVGNYPNRCISTRSERDRPNYTIYK